MSDESNDNDLESLREWGKELAGAMNSPWEPRCIERAFVPLQDGEIALTMQGWIVLSAERSPLLCGGLPGTIEECEQAAKAFGVATSHMNAEELVTLAGAMHRACDDAFSTILPMKKPGAEMGGGSSDGFGGWLPIWSFLVAQCFIDPDAALAMRVDRAYALVAATRRNQGWECSGTPYALRDLPEKEEEETNG